MAAVGAEALGDLARELARRREHQHAAAFARSRTPARGEPVQDGQREGRGLAGARLGDAEQVGALENGRNGLRLDGSWSCIAFAVERLEKGCGEAEFGEFRQLMSF